MACCASTLQSSVQSNGSAALRTGITPSMTTTRDGYHAQQFAHKCTLCYRQYAVCVPQSAAAHAVRYPAQPAANVATKPLPGHPVPMCPVSHLPPLPYPNLTKTATKLPSPYTEKLHGPADMIPASWLFRVFGAFLSWEPRAGQVSFKLTTPPRRPVKHGVSGNAVLRFAAAGRKAWLARMQQGWPASHCLCVLTSNACCRSALHQLDTSLSVASTMTRTPLSPISPNRGEAVGLKLTIAHPGGCYCYPWQMAQVETAATHSRQGLRLVSAISFMKSALNVVLQAVSGASGCCFPRLGRAECSQQMRELRLCTEASIPQTSLNKILTGGQQPIAAGASAE